MVENRKRVKISGWYPLVIIVIVIAGCGARAKLIKRYASIQDTKITAAEMKAYVAVEGNIQEQPSSISTAKTFFDLTDKGQKAFIETIAAKETKSEDFIEKLIRKLNSTPSRSNLTDNTIFTKRIVLSAKNLSHNPADRITSLLISLSFDPNITILSCDKVITQFGSYDAGTASFSRSSNLEVNGSLGGGFKKTGTSGTSGGSGTDDGNKNTTSSGSSISSGTEGNLSSTVSGKASNTTTYNEQVNLTLRYVQLSATVQDNKIDILQQSVSGVDLTGTTFLDVSFRYKKPAPMVIYDFDKYVIPATGTAAARPAKPDEITISENYLFFPNTSNDISVTATYQPVVRHVTRGDATITEADDNVAQLYIDAPISSSNLLIPHDQFNPVLWQLQDASTRNYLQLQSPIRQAGATDLYFNSFDKVKALLFWLKQKPGNISGSSNFSTEGYQLWVNGHRLTASEINKLHIVSL